MRRTNQEAQMAMMLALCALLPAQTKQTGSAGSAQSGAMYAEGMTLWREHRLAEAQARMEEASAMAPGDLRTLRALGRLDALVGKEDETVAVFRRLVEKAPRDVTAQLDLAIALAQKREFQEALALTTRVVEADQLSEAAHRLRAKLLTDLQRNEEALMEYRTVERLAPNDVLAQYDMAMLLGNLGETAAQITHLKRVLMMHPERAQYHFQLGQALQRSGDAKGAIAAWREAIRLQPGYREAIYSLSRALRRSDPDEAKILENQFQQIRQSEEQLNVVRNEGNSGVAAMGRADWKEAVALLREALDRCAGCSLEADLQKDLGLALCQGGELNEGEAMLVSALSLKPADADILRALDIVKKQLLGSAK